MSVENDETYSSPMASVTLCGNQRTATMLLPEYVPSFCCRCISDVIALAESEGLASSSTMPTLGSPHTVKASTNALKLVASQKSVLAPVDSTTNSNAKSGDGAAPGAIPVPGAG
jgi:hypothetical protein